MPACDAGVLKGLTGARRLALSAIQPLREERYKTFAEFLEALRHVEFRTLEHRHKDTYEMTGWWARNGVAEVFEGRRARDGLKVAAYCIADNREVAGVNNAEELDTVRRYLEEAQ